MLTLYLEEFTSFFEFLPTKVPYTLTNGELRLFASAVLLKSLGQLVCNGHAALSLMSVEDSDGKNGKVNRENINLSKILVKW